MRADIFSSKESVLLIGEGNFSFATELFNLNLSRDITATCFETSVKEDSETARNVEYLKEKGVQVLFGVDGTKLEEHLELKCHKYDKIVFNFPHVGGKMKIHLNRQLIRGFFGSAANLLATKGSVVVSLCRGQGGTGADCPLRRWDDTWQVVEMAAHADLVLKTVDPFRHETFPGYTCVGYRSRDVGFHKEDALVHVFRHGDPLYPNTDPDVILRSMDPLQIMTRFGVVECSNFLVTKYQRYLAQNKSSPVRYLCESVKRYIRESTPVGHLKLVSEEDVPLHVETPSGKWSHFSRGQRVPCELRHSLLDVLDLNPLLTDGTHFLVQGLIFRDTGQHFSLPPVSTQVLLSGHDVVQVCLCYIQLMFQMCQWDDVLIHADECKTMNGTSVQTGSISGSGFKVELKSDLVMKRTSGINAEVILAQEYSTKSQTGGCELSLCLIDMDKLAEVLFHLEDWRQLWAEGACVQEENCVPTLRLPSLFPVRYTFDLCVSNPPTLDEGQLYDVVWQVAGDIVVNMELRDVHQSEAGKRTRCYRLTYQSFDKPLFRKKAVAIHQQVIATAICLKLGVTVY